MNLGRDIEHGGYPNSETRTIEQKRYDANLYAGIGAKRRAFVQKGVDTTREAEVRSTQQNAVRKPDRSPKMTLTFKNLNKNGKDAIYTGAVRPIRFSLSLFGDGQPPATIEVDANLIPAKVKAQRVKLTPEERKAARAAKPKPTLAELAARAQKRADELAAKAASEQPSL